jgi:pimeloyl-ACP methyl ester carboxylesterase
VKLIGLVALWIVMSACGPREDAREEQARARDAVAEEAAMQQDAGFEAVTFRASDGKALLGGLAGSGEVGIVLCHGLKYVDGKDSFHEEALYFAEQGVAALAVSFRGYPANTIPPVQEGRDRDIVAAVSFLAGQGCRQIYVLGSSMGGWVALEAMNELAKDPVFAGLILISAGDPEAADDLACPKLFLVAKDDERILDRVRTMHATAAEPKKLVVFESGGHGQELFESRRDQVRRAVLDFVSGIGVCQREPVTTMMQGILIQVGEHTLKAVLNESETAAALIGRLPLRFQMARWGDEYYGDIGESLGVSEAEDARVEMELGEIAFWPPGNALCLFFGPTPASEGDEPRAASPVNPVGNLEGDFSVLKNLGAGIEVSVMAAEH